MALAFSSTAASTSFSTGTKGQVVTLPSHFSMPPLA